MNGSGSGTNTENVKDSHMSPSVQICFVFHCMKREVKVVGAAI